MQNYILDSLLKLKKISYVDKLVLNELIIKARSTNNLIRTNNTEDHFCSFFLPVNSENQSIFLVYHKKANSWIPPGGHIEKNESPIDAVKREIKEELSYETRDADIELVNVGVKQINNPKQVCKIHNDFWYVVYTPKQEFIVDKDEFYDARWFKYNEVANIVTDKAFKPIILGIIEMLNEKK